MTESGVTFDPAQLVMDDEWIAMIKYFVNGFRVDTETLAVADILAVGAFGDYLSLPATYAHMREQSQTRLMDRRVREDWAADGASDMYTRARAKACQILDTHKPPEIDADVKAQMRAVVARIDRERGAQ
jgi:trimethylamine--corrinoid protein Co-methyltransferase